MTTHLFLLQGSVNNPAERIVKNPRDLKHSIIDSSAFLISCGDGDKNGVDLTNLLSFILTPALTLSYFWISASTLDSVMSSGER